MNRYGKFPLLAVAIAAVCTVAHAAPGGMENDAMAGTTVKVPLAQAVTTAEQHANGKAARAEYENSKHGWIYDVEVVSGAKVFDVKVDADKGTVISSAEDKADRDDDHGQQVASEFRGVKGRDVNQLMSLVSRPPNRTAN